MVVLEIVLYVAGVIAILWGAVSRSTPELMAKVVWKRAYSIHQALDAYSRTGEKQFPDGNSANEAFRKLFETGLMDDPQLFWFSSSAWSSAEKRPESIKGNVNSDNVLKANECRFYYVRPNGTTTVTPIIFTRLGGLDGKVFDIVVTSGSGKIETNGDPTITVTQAVARKFGIDPKDILEPEGALPRTWEIPAPALPKWKAILLSPVTLFFLCVGAGLGIHLWRKRLRKSMTIVNHP